MKVLHTTILFLVLTVSLFSQNYKREYADPARYEEEIGKFEQMDRENFPPAGAVLCIGSSSMRLWHDSLAVDLAPLTVIPRGFGGSTMYDVLAFSDRIVIPYRPRAILLYEGDNDIADNMSPEMVRDTFRAFVKKVQMELPTTWIYLLSIKPSILREKFWPAMVQANALMKEVCEQNEMVTYIDVASGMIDVNGAIRSDVLLDDKLHMNRRGYEIWRDIVRPVIVEREEIFEPVGQ
jgi:lysophospholipase L1-like esterase